MPLLYVCGKTAEEGREFTQKNLVLKIAFTLGIFRFEVWKALRLRTVLIV